MPSKIFFSVRWRFSPKHQVFNKKDRESSVYKQCGLLRQHMSANPAPGHFRGSVGYEWISGFTQGDGCFSVCAIRNPKRKLGFNLVCNFKLDQQARSVYLLQAVREAFQGAGSLTYDGKGYWVYIVSSPTEIQEKVVPVFNACGFVGKKGRDYLFLKAVSFCMTKGQVEKQHCLT
eukprot:TRINITY_DN10515_c0_g1_i6.p1 TRINITY_DN10515_c0_g1~~TRINITY_DN10515_c0_g1_i6.p1  ORF type:complete len:175 (-),score=9.26 TRINITY_DN10515_c0_g1_i6:222-746(-)